MKKQFKLPKKFTEKLAQDLAVLLASHEGALLALQLLENLPGEAKVSLISNLSMVHSEEVARFFILIMKEYPGEKVGLIAERSLKKLKLAGVDITNQGLPPIKCTPENFSSGLLSKSRLKGFVSLVLFFRNQEVPETFDVLFFSLSFGEAGIKEFFYAKELTGEQAKELLQDENYLEITFEDALSLLNIAYDFNLDYDTLPALGYFIYQNLLESALKVSGSFNFYPVLAEEINPAILANGLCLAIRREDYHLIEELTGYKQVEIPEIGLLLANSVKSVEKLNGLWQILMEVIAEEDDGLYRMNWKFEIEEDKGMLILARVEQLESTSLEWNWLEEALSLNNITAAYYVHQSHGVRLFVESLEGVEFFQDGRELDFYKWWDLEKVLQKGLSFNETVIADLILGEEDLVIITDDQEKLEQVQQLLESNLPYELEILDDEMPVEVVYRIFDQEKMSFNQLIEQWTLTGSTRKEQVSTWLNTKFTELNGMTPLEASGSGEGAKLLWALVKKISKQGKATRDSMVDYRALLRSVGWGKKAGKNVIKSR